tara:strand:+ start:83 stop:241 length:159 start_codon:yes stop_codon:yes gene_type:complete
MRYKSERYKEALEEFYDIAEEENVDIIVISMKLFNKISHTRNLQSSFYEENE